MQKLQMRGDVPNQAIDQHVGEMFATTLGELDETVCDKCTVSVCRALCPLTLIIAMLCTAAGQGEDHRGRFDVCYQVRYLGVLGWPSLI